MIPKFKAKVKGGNIYAHHPNGSWMTSDDCIGSFDTSESKVAAFFWFLERGSLDPATLCMATGLKDKNGVEIYEWDIIRGANRGIGEQGYYDEKVHVVKFDNGCFIGEYWGLPVFEHADTCEIIGNIHDEVKK